MRWCALLVLLLPLSASAQDFAARRDATIAAVAERYRGEATYSSCVTWGFDTLYLVAAIDADVRGLAGGIALADATDDIEHLADEALRLIGEGGSRGPCAWESAGSPAALHGALGLGWLLHRHDDALPEAVRAKLERALGAPFRGELERYLVNGNMSVVAGLLLGGEALGYDSPAWTEGLDALTRIFEHVRDAGGLELNSPIYTHYTIAALAPLTTLRDARARAMARMLLDYILLTQAHLYVPGGGIGAPQARDYAGGARDGSDSGTFKMIGLWTGDGYEVSGNPHLTGPAVADYALPPVIESIFLDKAEGYTFWIRTDAPVAPSRMPNSYYPIGGDGAPVAPWQAAVLPDAMVGINYGFRYQSIHVSMGAYARAPDGSFAILYHAQPYVAGDQTESGNGLPSGGDDTDPDDFVRELMDFERLMVGRTMLSVWDPRPREGVRRQAPDTRAHVPDWETLGGEAREGGGWIVGSLGGTYVAYRPLGTVDADEAREGYRYLRLDGRSGCIVELATPAEVGTIDDYLADLRDRSLSFELDPLAVSFEARDPESGVRVPVRLEYRPERRVIDGVALEPSELLDHGMMESPWASWDEASGVLRVARGCQEGIAYDWDGVSVTSEPPPLECSTTVFSPVPTWGDARSWAPRTPSRWSVADRQGDLRYALSSFEHVPDGDRLGEYSLAGVDTDEVTLEMQVASDAFGARNADFAIVFGWRSADDYYFFLANATEEYNELFALEDGGRRSLGVASRALVTDDAFHAVTLELTPTEVVVRSDGEEVLRVEGAFAAGDVGIGSLNDGVLFDDVALRFDEPPASDGGAPPADRDGGSPTEPPPEVAEGGCGCRVVGAPSPPGWLLLLAPLLLARRRR